MITPEERLLIGRFTVQRTEQEGKLTEPHTMTPDKLSVGDNDVFDTSLSSMENPASRAGSRRVSEREGTNFHSLIILLENDFFIKSSCALEFRSRQGSTGTPPGTSPRRPFISEIPPFRQCNTPSPTHNLSSQVSNYRIQLFFRLFWHGIYCYVFESLLFFNFSACCSERNTSSG
jgi:hypothetical protein